MFLRIAILAVGLLIVGCAADEVKKDEMTDGGTTNQAATQEKSTSEAPQSAEAPKTKGHEMHHMMDKMNHGGMKMSAEHHLKMADKMKKMSDLHKKVAACLKKKNGNPEVCNKMMADHCPMKKEGKECAMMSSFDEEPSKAGEKKDDHSAHH